MLACAIRSGGGRACRCGRSSRRCTSGTGTECRFCGSWREMCCRTRGPPDRQSEIFLRRGGLWAVQETPMQDEQPSEPTEATYEHLPVWVLRHNVIGTFEQVAERKGYSMK